MNLRRPSRIPFLAVALIACTCSNDDKPNGVNVEPAGKDAAAAFGPPPTGAGPIVYVGGFRPEIDVFRLDMATAKLTQIGVVDSPPAAPSYFAWASSGKFAYSVDESDNGKVVSYTVNQSTGMLTRLNDASAFGVGPTYITLDKTGKFALTASWAEDRPASISVVPIGADGKVAAPVDSRAFAVNGHAHYITTDPTNKYVFASINGLEYIAQYKFDAATGKLTENTPDRVMRPKGGDPRHMDFHPNGKFLYMINEHGATVTVYAFDATTGLLTQIQDIPTLPAGYAGAAMNTTAQLLVHKSGKFVYGSNRGHNSIVIYSVDQATGMLTLIGHQTEGVGGRPRNFNFDPTGTLLLLASQDDGTITIFKVDEASGKLQQVGPAVPAGIKPTYVGVLNIPG
jgi:6-phosphogluconolactonase